MRWIWWLLRSAFWLILLGLVVTLALANRADVTLRLPLLEYELAMPVYVLVVGCVLLGVILAWMNQLPKAVKHWSAERKASAKIDAMQTELDSMKITAPTEATAE